MTYSKKVKSKPSVLWIGDAVAHTGFATVTHGILDKLHRSWDVTVLGLNYHGDPHPYAYPIWPAYKPGGDMYGFAKLSRVLNSVKPDLVCILNDPWSCREYIKIIKDYDRYRIDLYKNAAARNPSIPAPTRTKIAIYTPVDAKHIKPDFVAELNEADLVVCYTAFGLNELSISGLTAKTGVAPHGIDPSVYYPMPKAQARKKLNIQEDWYVVGLVNRNQPRKRLDLAFEYFARWAANKPDNVKIYYHGSLRDAGWDIIDLAELHGVEDRLILTSDSLSSSVGVSRDTLRHVYNSFDVQFTTTMGEG